MHSKLVRKSINKTMKNKRIRKHGKTRENEKRTRESEVKGTDGGRGVVSERIQ